MPELPEVERARSLLSEIAEGKKIIDIETFEDTIVYAGGITHTEFADAFRNKTIDNVLRVGKQMYFTTKDGPSGLVHLGMSGHTFVRGAHQQMYYRKIRPKDRGPDGQPLWPPRYCKLILRLDGGEEWAFTDARRLGRIRMVEAGTDPLSVPPLSLLGRDAFNDLPSLEELRAVFKKRTAPIKALLLDQNGPCSGIGNYLIDEICYQSRVHPAQRASTLDDTQSAEIYRQIQQVIRTALEAKADYRAFPKNWIFSVRWGRGRRGETPQMLLENGEYAPVTFETVGGRTSAIVEAVQQIPEHGIAAVSKPGRAKGSSSPGKRKKRESSISDTGSDADVLEAVEHDQPTGAAIVVDEKPARSTPKRKARKHADSKSPYFERDSDADSAETKPTSPIAESEDKPISKKRGGKRARKTTDEVGDDSTTLIPAKRTRKKRV